MTNANQRADRGASLILVMAVVAILAAVSAALIQYAGDDRVNSARRAQEARSLSCADVGIEVARRIVGCSYKETNNWNDYLKLNTDLDPAANVTLITGTMNGESPGGDFEVRVEDDRDEEPNGQPNNPERDNNLTLILRSRCTNPLLSSEIAGEKYGAVTEVRLVYIPGLSEHGSAPSGSNAMESAVGGARGRRDVRDCPPPAGSAG